MSDDFDRWIEDNFEGWSTDGYGLDSCLICPHGHTIELDGQCPEGCVSPIRDAGLV